MSLLDAIYFSHVHHSLGAIILSSVEFATETKNYKANDSCNNHGKNDPPSIPLARYDHNSVTLFVRRSKTLKSFRHEQNRSICEL